VTSWTGKARRSAHYLWATFLLKLGPSTVTYKDLSKITARLAPKTLVVATVLRAGAQQSVALTIGRLPDPPIDPALTGDQDTWVAGLSLGVANTTAEIRKAIKANDDASGLIVTSFVRRVREPWRDSRSATSSRMRGPNS